MPKVDFFHVGFHKTASTWFQEIGYKRHSDISLVNGDCWDSVFYNRFIGSDYASWRTLDETMVISTETDGRLNGICDENLTGHFWTGRNACKIAQNIYEYNPHSKVVFVVRDQVSMIDSLYFNYVRNGGFLTFKELVNDICFEGHLVREKLEYHRLIELYLEYFGRDRVLVVPYEEFRLSPASFLARIAAFLDVQMFSSYETDLLINKKLARGERDVMRVLGRAGFNPDWSRQLRKVGRILPSKGALAVPTEFLTIWAKSNRMLERLLGIDLDSYGYLI